TWSAGHLRVPAVRDDLLRRGLLLVARELDRGVDLRQRLERLRVGRARRLHRVEADRPGQALEPDVLALVAVEELLPQAGGSRVRRELADRLAVEAAEDAVAGDVDLPLDAGLLEGVRQPRVDVVPVDGQRGLTALHRGRRDLDRVEVAGVLDLLEEVDPGAD